MLAPYCLSVALLQAPTLTQEEIQFHDLRATDWLFVKKLLEDLQHDFAQDEKFLVDLTSRYTHSLKLFRMCEELTICNVAKPTQRDITYHRGALAIFKGLGHLLLGDLRLHEEIDIKKWLGVRFEDISAIVDELEYDEAMHYGDVTKKRKEEICGSIFG